jgi:Ser/Thr protein kinase RdoA (MazF antagonist)
VSPRAPRRPPAEPPRGSRPTSERRGDAGSGAGNVAPGPAALAAGAVPVTESFFALTPERVLAAVDAAGLTPTGLCYPLNSYENRVYEIELADPERTRLVAKFYRPGRWRAEQILEEHQFITELATAEIPVATVRPFPDGSTLRTIEGIFYSLADRFGGRAPDELDEALAERLGMLAGRLHNVGASHPAAHRWQLDATRFVREPLAWLAAHATVPPRLWRRYESAAQTIAEAADRVLPGLPVHRIHGDLHRGNLLLREGRLAMLDFDDMAMGPAVQDLWLALPTRDREGDRLRGAFLEGYRQFRSFEDAWLAAIEPLRGLRLVHYAVWLARRADDPAFQRAWPDFGTADWWEQETQDLEAQARAVRDAAPAPAPAAGTPGHRALDADPTTLTNKDYFWDWEG